MQSLKKQGVLYKAWGSFNVTLLSDTHKLTLSLLILNFQRVGFAKTGNIKRVPSLTVKQFNLSLTKGSINYSAEKFELYNATPPKVSIIKIVKKAKKFIIQSCLILKCFEFLLYIRFPSIKKSGSWMGIRYGWSKKTIRCLLFLRSRPKVLVITSFCR